jgi:hypothetical protein
VNNSVETIHRFVSHRSAMRFVQLGWMPLDSLQGTHHGEYRVHLVWVCCCEQHETPPDPVRKQALFRAARKVVMRARRRRLDAIRGCE